MPDDHNRVAKLFKAYRRSLRTALKSSEAIADIIREYDSRLASEIDFFAVNETNRLLNLNVLTSLPQLYTALQKKKRNTKAR